MSESDVDQPGGGVSAVGFIGLGDQGLPMAIAIAEAGFALHVWARRPSSLHNLTRVPHISHDSAQHMAAACDLVAYCVGTDDDVLELAADMRTALRPGSMVVNHGTGTPGNARRLNDLLAQHQVHVLDAPVSGGRPAAEKRQLTVLVGGPVNAVHRAQPVLQTFARHVIHLGNTGAGQLAKLFNNTLLMMNQASIADVVDLAARTDIDPAQLVEALKLGSGSSAALTLLNTMITPDTVDHLSEVQDLDMHIFDQAMREASINASAVTERGLSGTRRLADTLARVSRGQQS